VSLLKQKKLAQLALNVAADAIKIEESANGILTEAENVGNATNTVVAEVTAMAGVTEQMKRNFKSLLTIGRSCSINFLKTGNPINWRNNFNIFSFNPF